ncbi:hypothetical protein [Cupriavidus taiwanensis]|uniref:hypothetical protein n=1 Tax=Cupriavidus taiwanensis TaxID=164546 RepID=UPI0011C07E01|nr:hypothetical protein [Cupriavidus taiwanensis]
MSDLFPRVTVTLPKTGNGNDMRSIIQTAGFIAIAMAGTFFTPADAAKCRSGKSILYTQDQYCPSGYTDISNGMSGSVSTYSMTAQELKSQQDYLASREQDKHRYQVQLAREQQAMALADNQERSGCQAIDSQLRANENAMRQINAWQTMEQLKQNRKQLQEQRYRLGCHR